MTALRVVLIFVVVAAAATVGFVAFDHSDPPATTTTTTTTTTTVPATTTTTTTIGTAAACTGHDFLGAFGLSQGAGGTIYVPVTATNETTAPCTIDGWPTLVLEAGGKSLGATIVESNSEFAAVAGVPPEPTTITVQPGGAIHFELAFSDVPTGGALGCITASVAIFSIAPSTASTYLLYPEELAPCGDPPTVFESPIYS